MAAPDESRKRSPSPPSPGKRKSETQLEEGESDEAMPEMPKKRSKMHESSPVISPNSSTADQMPKLNLAEELGAEGSEDDDSSGDAKSPSESPPGQVRYRHIVDQRFFYVLWLF